MKKEYFDACMMLDRLQVELCEDTPYDIPSASQTRERILKVMDLLEKMKVEEEKDVFLLWKGNGKQSNYIFEIISCQSGNIIETIDTGINCNGSIKDFISNIKTLDLYSSQLLSEDVLKEPVPLEEISNLSDRIVVSAVINGIKEKREYNIINDIII